MQSADRVNTWVQHQQQQQQHIPASNWGQPLTTSDDERARRRNSTKYFAQQPQQSAHAQSSKETCVFYSFSGTPVPYKVRVAGRGAAGAGITLQEVKASNPRRKDYR